MAVSDAGPAHGKPLEQRLVADDPGLDDLGQAGPELGAGQGAQQIGIDQHQLRLFERAHQVFPRRQIDRHLAADAGIHHRQQAGGDLDERHAAQPRGRDESGQIADNAAAEGDHRLVARELRVGEPGIEAGGGIERLVRFAVRDLEDQRFEAGFGQRLDQDRRVASGDVGIRDHRATARLDARVRDATAGLGQEARRDEHGVAGDCGFLIAGFGLGRRSGGIRIPHSAIHNQPLSALRQPRRDPHHALGRGGDGELRGVEVIGNRGVGFGALRQQPVDAGQPISAGKHGPVVVVADAAQERFGRCVEADERAAAGQRVAVRRVDGGASADRDHQPGRSAQLLADRRLDGSESRFAILGEDGRDRLAGALDDDVVQIDEGPAQPRRDLAGRSLPSCRRP